LSALNDIIGRVIDECDAPDGIDTHRAVDIAFPLVIADEEARDQIIREGLWKRIKDQATRALRRLQADGNAQDEQLDLFGQLKRRYALDIDGRRIKNTADLSRLEFRRLIAIREQQIEQDTAHLKVLRDVESAVSLVWDILPDQSLGRVMAVYLAKREAA
jgi:hypothetical protein